MNRAIALILAVIFSGSFGRLDAADIPPFLLRKNAKVEAINLSDGRYYLGVEVEAGNQDSNWIMITYSFTGKIHPDTGSRPRQMPEGRQTVWINLLQVTSIAGANEDREQLPAPDEK